MIQSSNPERFFKPLIDKGCLGRAQTAIQPAGNRRETGSLKTAPTATHRCSHSGIAPGQPLVLRADFRAISAGAAGGTGQRDASQGKVATSVRVIVSRAGSVVRVRAAP